MGGGFPSTPTTNDQAYGTDGYSADAFPLMVEIFRDVKHIFQVAPSTAFTKGTGGEQFPFATSHGLEQAITRIGDEIHSQYLLSFTPQESPIEGYHKLEVSVPSRPDAIIRARPGYWPERPVNR